MRIKIKRPLLGCNIFVMLIFLAYMFIAGWSMDLILNFFGKDIPFLGDCILGIFVGEFTIPLVLLGLLLKVLGVF